jgi:hypothetical protein
MEKLILLIAFIISSSVSAQDFAKDTLLGTTPSSILKIKKHKIFIAQNKELQTPFLKQKDGSFISNGVPFIQVYIDQKKHTIGSSYDYIDVLFDKLGGSNEIIEINNTRILIHYDNKVKDKKEQIFVFYPLSDRFLNFNFVYDYKDDDDRYKKKLGIYGIIKNGLLVGENYYLTNKI